MTNENDIKTLTELLKKGVNLESLLNGNNETWESKLDRLKNGGVKPTFNNHVLTWENHPLFKGWTLKYNDFLRQIEINNEPINDVWRAKIRNKLEEAVDISSKQKTDDFIDEYSDRFKYNPVIDYLNSIRNKKNTL